MFEEGDRFGIPQKLRRYLATIARRKSIRAIRIAAVMVDSVGVVLDSSNRLPSTEVSDGLDAAIGKLARELGISNFRISYAGFFDEGKTRQYNFLIESDQCSYKRVEVDAALRLMDPKEAEAVGWALEAKKRGVPGLY